MKEKYSRKVIECAYCHKCEYFKCKNFIGSVVRKLQNQLYFCSPECSSIYLQLTRNAESESQVLKKLRNVSVEVRGTREELQAVKNTVREIEKFQNFLSGKLDSLLSEVKNLKKDKSELKNNFEGLREKQVETSDTVHLLELEVDRLNRATTSKKAIVLGIPMKSNKSVRQLNYNIAAVIGCQLPDGTIVEANRLINENKNDTKQPPIKVSFSEERFKEELFTEKKKRFGQLLSSTIDPSLKQTTSKVILRDELTAYGMKLLQEVLRTNWT
ncbi:uncharacterized protein LOC129720052 [Wyeomyia smithii]|uniref:uncharacterized protein LOC129720052 n=1 Tax=Wyeomyia smithii TaxID=174621 RepID=UPI00246818EF|nr:uncharacterized protein LOC129720052 [Wyeomyia smithii]